MTYRDALKEGERLLLEAGIADAAEDAWYILSCATRVDRTQFYMLSDEPVSTEDGVVYYALISRRCEHIPLQYIMGSTEFYGLTFKVNENVLIPRQDTETLVDEALKYVKNGDRVLDLCTGSGCVLLSIMNYRNQIKATGVDISRSALLVARENADALKCIVQWVCSDLYAGITDTYNVITANPPYIGSDVIPGLMPEVRDFEPQLALDGGPEGLDFYPRIVEGAREHLENGGALLVEIGYDQGEAVKAIFEQAGFSEVEIVKDLPGQDRVVKGIYNV